jgi:Fe2+ transport system protein B
MVYYSNGFYRCQFCFELYCLRVSAGVLTDLISQGIIQELAVSDFIPQIAFLFMFISILEESGYMSRGFLDG